ncbi:MAG: NEW3 domain-containing protein [Candidatus Nanoarchaeia archaeon]|nr:NEW3 domain-containing protein [Candidatus Nanoarchaeia archaeon]
MSNLTQFSGYGGYYSQQQQGAAQYAYPKKKFPWLYAVLGAAAVLTIGLIVYFLFFMQTSPALELSSPSIDIQTSPGDSATSTVTVTNPRKSTIQTNLQTNLPAWITIDKTSLTLRAGETATVTITASPVADSQTTSGSINFEGTDVFVQINAQVLPVPQISLNVPTTSFTIYEGEKRSILATVSNTGLSNAVNANLSITGIPAEWLQMDTAPFTLEAGKEVSKTIVIDIPEIAETGNYQGLLNLKGTGFSQDIILSFSILPSVGSLTVTPSDISGTKTSGSNIRLTIENSGNANLNSIVLQESSSLKASLSITPRTVALIEPGQSSEVILVIDGINGTKNGNIEVTATDTHGNTQTKFVTVAISVT